MKRIIPIIGLAFLCGCSTVRQAVEDVHSSIIRVIDTTESLTTNVVNSARNVASQPTE